MSDETVRLIEKTADDLFAAESARARDALADGAWPERLWQAFAATGLAQAALPEEAGGAGLAAVLAVLRAAGRHAAPLPVAETLIGTLLCWLTMPEVPAGPLTLEAPRTGDPDAAPVGREDIDAVTFRRVPWARFASVLVVLPSVEGLALPKPSDVVEGSNLAGEPRDDITVAGPPAAFYPLAVEVDWFALMALARAAQLRGAMEQVLAMSMRLAQEREQFGRPLARFQAIQHHLAAIAGEVAASGAAVDAAERAGTPFAFAAAKARASQAAGTVARLAHQVHGAIGYTAEHDLHHWTKRLWAWRDEFGSEAHWWSVLGEKAAYGGAEALWPIVVSGGEGVLWPTMVEAGAGGAAAGEGART